MSRVGKAVALTAASLSLAGCVSNDGPPEATPMTPAEMYRVVAEADQCPAFQPVDVRALPVEAWREPPTTVAFHRQFRSDHGGVAVPEGGTRVLASWRGGHHEVVAGSFAAVRTTAGRWSADVVSTYRSLVPTAPGQPPRETQVQRRAWTISEANGRALDTLIASRCLAAEPRSIILHGSVPSTGPRPLSCVGGAVVVLEVFTSEGRIASAQHCGRWGAAGEVQRLLFADAPR